MAAASRALGASARAPRRAARRAARASAAARGAAGKGFGRREDADVGAAEAEAAPDDPFALPAGHARAAGEEYFLFARSKSSKGKAGATWLPLGMLLTEKMADVSTAVAQRERDLRVFARARHGALMLEGEGGIELGWRVQRGRPKEGTSEREINAVDPSALPVAGPPVRADMHLLRAEA